jgi:hypothetical protein
MISFEELDRRIRKQYLRVLQAHVRGENIFPLTIRADKTAAADFVTRNKQLEELYAHSSHHHPFGYLVETATIHRRLHGTQDEPVAFYFDTLERFLGYTREAESFAAFTADIQFIKASFPLLVDWLATHTAEVIAYHGKWPALLQVADYFLQHPRPGLFARELPLQGLGTKFVENHKAILYSLLNQLLAAEAIDESASGLAHFEKRFGLRTDAPRIRFRWLDAKLADEYTGGIEDVSVPINEISHKPWLVKRVLIVENKTNLQRADLYLTLPDMQGTMAIFGSGRAAALLAGIEWLKQAEILYWGDIDAEGFEILDNLLQYFPQAKAFCMDGETLAAFTNEITHGSGAMAKNLLHLSAMQNGLYQQVCAGNNRLEQEQIGQDWVRERVLVVIGSCPEAKK